MHILRLALVSLVLFTASLGAANERILDYDSLIEVHLDGSLEITETIRVRAEGHQIRRGIYRNFPTRYFDRLNNRVVVGFEVLEVLRDGQPEPWFTERLANGVRINTGDDTLLPVPAEIEYTIRYRTTRQLGFFDDHDELYFNAIGSGWRFLIDQARATVRLPQPVPEQQLNTGFFTGPPGHTGQDATASIPAAGTVRFETTRALLPGYGLTIVVEFPKGIVTEPDTVQKIQWFLYDNRGVLIALLGFFGVLLFYLFSWYRKGRDPAPGAVFARYHPPEGYSPGGLRYVSRMAYDDRCFTADVIDMAVKGVFTIRHDVARSRLSKARWHLERAPGSAAHAELSPSQRALFDTLFKRRKSVSLEPRNADLINRSRSQQRKALRASYQPRYFIRNVSTIIVGLLTSVLIGIAAFIVARGDGLPLLITVLALLLILNLVFMWLMKAPTQRGRQLLDHIDGLRLYLSVAERDELSGLEHRHEHEPPLDAARYESLLPYAIALSVEDAWTAKLTAAIGTAAAAAAASGIAWYHGSGAQTASLSQMSQSLGSALNSQVASSATPPGSTSGGGGGGFSGGGGGGGGGGGR